MSSSREMGLKLGILPRSQADCQKPRWKQDLAAALTRAEDLFDLLGLDPQFLPAADAAAKHFPLRVPRGYAGLITTGDPGDPLLRQILPVEAELDELAGFTSDPVGDKQALRVPGVLQKYRGRALLVVTGACPIHCRYCFRRHFPYTQSALTHERCRTAIEYLESDPSVSEVVLSGGDPLMLDDARLTSLIQDIEAIAHIKRLRLHTRVPIVLPSRVTPELCHTLACSRLPTVLVIHTNHARELSAEARAALTRLRGTQTQLLNQSVLLRGVNDSAAALADLSEALFDSGVLPYYLHRLDRVAGAAHFEVPTDESVALMEELRAALPGYLVPRLVEEIPGADSKRPIC